MEVEKVTIRTVDSIIDELKIKTIDFIKIDVEGFDYDVLIGAHDTIIRYHFIMLKTIGLWSAPSLLIRFKLSHKFREAKVRFRMQLQVNRPHAINKFKVSIAI